MVSRITPEEYFNLQEEEDSGINMNSLLHLGLIIIGVVACVAIVAMVIVKK